MRVKALDTYERLNIKDKELNKVIKVGEEFEVTKERFKVLTGNNKYNEIFVEEINEVIETAKKKVKSETAVKRKKKSNDI